ncbi:MAG: phosphotransferase [Anaerolineales bacterium]
METQDAVLNAKVHWVWPFTKANLTAGLRRYRGDPTLVVEEVVSQSLPHGRPSIGRVTSFKAHYRGRNDEGMCDLVLKEPLGTTRTGLAGAGRREVGVYKSLAEHLPVNTPGLIAASPLGDWLILEMVSPAVEPDAWSRDDYLTAIDSLTQLHDRFWNLGEDLQAFPWLGRPLEADFEVHVMAATHAIERIIIGRRPKGLAKVPRRMEIFAKLTSQAEAVIAPLKEQPMTLLHGDYWPGNISVLEDRTQVVYDWQLTGVGPGVLDLLVFVNKSAWWFEAIPVDAEVIIHHYRERMAAKVGISWTDDVWQLLWDHALMWRFLQEWVDLLAASPEPLLETRGDQLDRVWLGPVADAVDRRLGD